MCHLGMVNHQVFTESHELNANTIKDIPRTLGILLSSFHWCSTGLTMFITALWKLAVDIHWLTVKKYRAPNRCIVQNNFGEHKNVAFAKGFLVRKHSKHIIFILSMYFKLTLTNLNSGIARDNFPDFPGNMNIKNVICWYCYRQVPLGHHGHD